MKKIMLVLALILTVNTIFSLNSSELGRIEKDIVENIAVIDMILDSFEIEGSTYQLSFDYYYGFLRGRRQAYSDVLKQIQE
jgi:hypothetical protein